jgi:hypothetical protein
LIPSKAGSNSKNLSKIQKAAEFQPLFLPALGTNRVADTIE